MSFDFPASNDNSTERFDVGPLSWVMGEVREAINLAGNMLKEALAQVPENQATPLRHAKSYLHQVHGALQIVDVDGVSVLTESIEAVFDKLQSGELELNGANATTVQEALHAVLSYLEDLLAGAMPQPVRLFPYYKDLQILLGTDRIHPADLFFPSLNEPALIPEMRSSVAATPLDFAALRKSFENKLLGVLTAKQEDVQRGNAQDMCELLRGIESAQSSSQAKAFWLVMSAFAEAYAAGTIEAQQYTKQIFARINLQIRRLSEGNTNIPERLLRDALFFLAQAEHASPLAAQIARAYHLQNQVPVNYEQKTYGQIAPQILLGAREALSQVKNLWGRIANGESNLADKFSLRIKDLAGFGAQLKSPPLEKLLRELSGIARHAAHANPGEKIGLELATSLLFVENALEQITHLPPHFSERAEEITNRLLSVVSGEQLGSQAAWIGEISREAQQKQTMTVLVAEMQASLRQVEKNLDEYFRDPHARTGLLAVDPVLHQIGGALAILDQDDAMAAVEHTRVQVAQLAADESGTAAQQDKLSQSIAQNVGALSFFLETLQTQPDAAAKKFSYDAASGTLRSHLLTRSHEKELLPTLDLHAELQESGVHSGMLTAEHELELQQQQSAMLAANLMTEPQNQSLHEQLKDSLEHERSVATVLDDSDAASRAHAAITKLAHEDKEVQQSGLNELAHSQPTLQPVQDLHLDLPQGDEAVDAELLEIFLTEADEVLGFVDQIVPQSRLEPSNQDHLTSLRRSFHTLKGSGRMVGLNVFGEAAWNIEQVMNLWLSESRDGTENLYALLEKASAELFAWVSDLKQHAYSQRNGEALIAAAQRVKAGQDFSYQETAEPIAAAPAISAVSAEPAQTESPAAIPLEEMIAQLPVETALPDLGLPPLEFAEAELPSASEENSQQENEPVLQEMMESVPEIVHETGEDTLVATLPDESEDFSGLNKLPELPASVSAQIIDFPDITRPTPVFDDNIKRIGDIEISLPLHTIYMAETDEIVRFLAQDFAEWRHEAQRHVTRHAIHAAHSLAGSSATVGLMPVQELAHALEKVLQRLERHPVALECAEYDVLDACLDCIKRMLQKFALSEMADRAPSEVQQLDQLLQAVILRSNAAVDEFLTSTNEILELDDLADAPLLETGSAAQLNNQDEAVSLVVPSMPAVETPTAAPVFTEVTEPVAQLEQDVALASDTETRVKDELDQDLLPVFIEEGRDLLPMIGQLLRTWQEHPADVAIPQSILRLLHTVKGSARMAGAMELGQQAHDLEAHIENLMHAGGVRQTGLDDLFARHDHILQLFDRLEHPQPEITADTDADGRLPLSELPELPATGGAIAPTVPTAAVQPIARPFAAPAVAAPLVRVRADILDRLVNQAGEVSISRSKLENEVSTLRTSLAELTDNVNRLRDQLREVEIQAETQISSRMSLAGDREFDPLEFDRFTRLQELTRMMAESVSDVAAVQNNLTRTVDGASTDLHAQARLTRELQQDLMRVRMVPFASISERLYRVTRQAAKELDKRVNLDIRGSGVEIDRSVLEKMGGPFEHLLRNAIVHGIESHEVRKAAGKNEIGELLIEVRQEGNEVVIQFTDDGQGLDLPRIRDKAVAAGLLSYDAAPGDVETVNMIFEPGFSTVTEVTELAGRGVGMDVVRSEAAALGGRVAVSSDQGKGSRFTIHLPLTLAVTQVVILTSGGKTYAVPSVLVEQVQQLKANTLATAYNDGAISWQGERVPMYYLSAMLGDHAAVAVSQQYSPLLIMKSGSQRVAIHVDDVIGNREVVVKNIGPQLSRMVGIAGATVLGSGEIVLILNPVPLSQKLEHDLARLPRTTAQEGEELGAVANMHNHAGSASVVPVPGLRTQHTVMVVDDSLTVRRVTQRLLTREGYQVVLAKDGIDALEQLQTVTPDVMLVDIEMPRMDGFDLTRNVRGDARTRAIPIIMITSRTADKHRNYAKELGVNEYFGKPYREDDLLQAIGRFISQEALSS